MRYLILTLLLFVGCGPLGDDLHRSWMCMTQGGGQYCDGDNTKGEKGEQGNTGPEGRQGPAGIPGPVGQPGNAGPAGSVGPSGQPGAQGEMGPKGEKGDEGDAGTSCSVTYVANGSIISCTDGTSVVILNGVDGADGQDAPPTPYTVTGLIDPCGKQGQFDEVLLRLANGSLLAHYASGSNQFLVVIGPGNYKTTDGTNCFFSINSNMEITNEHN